MSVNSTLQSITFVSKIMMTRDSTNVKLVLIMILTTGFECCYGYNISECGSDGKVDLDETSPAVLTCTGITNDTVYWNLDRTGGAGHSIALCEWPNTTCSTDRSDWYEVTRTEYNTSTLTVQQSHRKSIVGTVTCGTARETSIPASCRVRVVRIADKVTNCSVTVNNTVKKRDWLVTASCDVEKMYASDGHYSCRWFVPDENGTETEEEGSLDKTSFTDNDTDYFRGTCSISNLPMPTPNGIRNYNVSVNPGITRSTGPRLEIKQPGTPKLLNCPEHVTEGDDVNCTCQASNSSPPAITTWFTGISEYNSLLQLRNVSRDKNGISYTCTQFWGGPSPTFEIKSTYTLRVTSVGATPTTTGTPKDTNTDTPNTGDAHNDDTGDEGLPIAIIAGGAGGGLVVIIIVIIVVVAVKRRGGSPQLVKNTESTEDDFEEHINYLYESSDNVVIAMTSRLPTNQAARHPRDTNATNAANEEVETDNGYTRISALTLQPTTCTRQRNADTDTDFEEHINVLYESSDAVAGAVTSRVPTSQREPDPSNAHIPTSTDITAQDADFGYSTIPPSANAGSDDTSTGVYSTPDVSGVNVTFFKTSALQPDGVGVYSEVS